MWTIVVATPEQVDKIHKKYFQKGMIIGLSCYQEEIGDTAYIEGNSIRGGHFCFQYRYFRSPDDPGACFLEFNRIGSSIRYDVNEPRGEFHKRLTELAKKAQKRFLAGGEL
jgi:hypothetical protein